jgi:hypothetical protein
VVNFEYFAKNVGWAGQQEVQRGIKVAISILYKIYGDSWKNPSTGD